MEKKEQSFLKKHKGKIIAGASFLSAVIIPLLIHHYKSDFTQLQKDLSNIGDLGELNVTDYSGSEVPKRRVIKVISSPQEKERVDRIRRIRGIGEGKRKKTKKGASSLLKQVQQYRKENKCSLKDAWANFRK